MANKIIKTEKLHNGVEITTFMEVVGNFTILRTETKIPNSDIEIVRLHSKAIEEHLSIRLEDETMFNQARTIFHNCFSTDKRKRLLGEIYDLNSTLLEYGIIDSLIDDLEWHIINEPLYLVKDGCCIDGISYYRELDVDNLNSITEYINPEYKTKFCSTYKMFSILTKSNDGSTLLNTLDSLAYKENCKQTVYTYIATDNSGLYKIGKSINPDERLKILKTGNPTIHLVCIIPLNVEKQLHNRFSHVRVNGEWFNISKEEVEKIAIEFNTSNGQEGGKYAI